MSIPVCPKKMEYFALLHSHCKSASYHYRDKRPNGSLTQLPEVTIKQRRYPTAVLQRRAYMVGKMIGRLHQLGIRRKSQN